MTATAAARPPKKRGMSQSAREQARLALLYILPAGIVILLITLYPLLYQVFMAFTNYTTQHLRLTQSQAIGLVAWSAVQQPPDEFVAAFSADYAARNDGGEPGRWDIRNAYYATPEFKESYDARMGEMGIDESVRRIASRTPLVWQGFTNFKDIIWNSAAFQRFLNPMEKPSEQSTLSYRWEQFWNALRGALKVSNYDFLRLFLFNLAWTIINVFFHVAIGVAVAVILNLKGVVLKGLYRSLYILPWAIPSFVTATVWNYMFDSDFGAINQTIVIVNNFLANLLGQNPATFNPLPEGIRWLESLQAPLGIDLLPLSFYAALLTNIWLGWPFMMMVATGALQAIPKDMYEAATVDGATWWQQFWRITVPLLRPAMIPAIMLGFIWTYNQFNVIFIVTQGKPLGRTEIMATQAYKLIQEQRLYGVASAFTIVVFIILFAINAYTNRVTRAAEGANV